MDWAPGNIVFVLYMCLNVTIYCTFFRTDFVSVDFGWAYMVQTASLNG
jgi:hypothetical protein